MVALVPTRSDAQRLAVGGDQAHTADEMHVTLLFLGPAAEWNADQQAEVHRRIAALAAECDGPIPTRAWGAVAFNPGSDREFVGYLVGNDSTGKLTALHAAVSETAAGSGPVPDQYLPWEPHFTAVYGSHDTRPLHDRTGPVVFDRIAVFYGSDATLYPLGGGPPERLNTASGAESPPPDPVTTSGTVVGEESNGDGDGSRDGDNAPGERSRDVDSDNVVEKALERRGVHSAEELRNPLGSAAEACERAKANEEWWKTFSDTEKQMLIEAYPQHIGNAEGITAADRDAANQIVRQQLRDRADQIQSTIDEFGRPSREDRKFLKRVKQFEETLREARRDAQLAGEDGPLLLAFDPAEFGGDGRAVLSFGHDPYTADSVSWLVPGIKATIHNSYLGFYARCALNHLQSTHEENPTLKAASIAWIGYDTPSGVKGLWRALGQKFARMGGEILFSDISAFNTARDTAAGDGSHFKGNHVIGYSYGAPTTSSAGVDGRLNNQARTVSLVGPPGAGPIRHASEFGPTSTCTSWRRRRICWPRWVGAHPARLVAFPGSVWASMRRGDSLVPSGSPQNSQLNSDPCAG